MRFILNTRFRLLAMMLNEPGFKCRIHRQTTNWLIVVLCLIGLMHTIEGNNPCLNGDCNNETTKLLRQEKRLSIQQRELELMQKQKELQLQLQKLYLEQHQLELEMKDAPDTSAYTGLEYEIPSYCANCLGDSFEPSAKSSLSSEYARKNSEDMSASNQQLPQLSDHGRLEAIKFQILLKLGLKNKPNVTSSLPKQFIFDTLRRSGDPTLNWNDYTMLFQSSDNNLETRDLVLDQLQQLKVNNDSVVDDLKAEEFKEPPQPEDDQEFDDFYGRTREIITFAEKGHHKLNGHHLLEFSTSIDNQTSTTLPKLKIRQATLWVMIGSSLNVPDNNQDHTSNDIVQLKNLSRKRASKHSSNVNTLLIKKSLNQSRRKRKRKRKDDSEVDSDSNMYYFENHSYNHITKNNNNDGNHIIKTNRNANGRRKIKSFDSNDSNKFNQTSKAGRDHHHSHKNLTLWIFRIKKAINKLNSTENISDKEFDSLSKLSASKTVSLRNTGWQKLDVTGLIQEWYQEDHKEGRLQLFIDCSGCRDKVQVHLFPHKFSAERGRKRRNESDQNAMDSDATRPFLVVHIEPNVVKRNRRRALDCSVATKTQCCKQRFYVSFKALGWDDWIIAPAGYYANYCSGSCGGGLNRTPDTFLTYYSHVFHEVRKYNKLNGNQLCCAPLKFSSMSLIYFGPDSKIIKRDLPKMVVDECGCP